MGILRVSLGLAIAFAATGRLEGQREPGSFPLDRSKPVPPKSEILAAWQARQQTIQRFRFAWTEEQTHPRGWVPNPRYAARPFRHPHALS